MFLVLEKLTVQLVSVYEGLCPAYGHTVTGAPHHSRVTRLLGWGSCAEGDDVTNTLDQQIAELVLFLSSRLHSQVVPEKRWGGI